MSCVEVLLTSKKREGKESIRDATVRATETKDCKTSTC